MGTRVIRHFLDSIGALFFAGALAFLIGIHASAGLELPQDSLFHIPLRMAYWIFSGLALGIAIVCLFSHKTNFKVALILWMTLNAVIYAVAVQWNAPKGDFSAYLSYVADAFNIAPATAFWMAKAICLYLLIGSGAVLIFGKRHATLQYGAGLAKSMETLDNPPQLTTQTVPAIRRPEALVRTLKISCTACGGHIEFPTNFFGEQVPCPHCQASIVLQKARNLKMSCTCCDGHIQFPVHALGQKISCPHCNGDITLKEPA